MAPSTNQKLFVQYDLYEYPLPDGGFRVEVQVWIHQLNSGIKTEPQKRVMSEAGPRLDHARIAALTRAHIWVMEMVA